MRDGDVMVCTIKGCEFKRVGEKRTPMCELWLQGPQGEELTAAIWMTEKALPIARAQLKKCGFPIDEHDLTEVGEWIASGHREVEVIVESYEGRNGAISYRGAIETGANRLAKDDLSKLTGALRAVKKQDGEEAAPQKPAPRTPAASPSRPAAGAKPNRWGDPPDDIPF